MRLAVPPNRWDDTRVKRHAAAAIIASLVLVPACDKSGSSGDEEPASAKAGSDKGTSAEPAAAKPAETKASKSDEVGKAKETAEAKTPPPRVEVGELAGWEKRTSPEGGYTILAPTKGLLQTSSTPTPAGPAKTFTLLYQKEGDPGALMVMYMDMPVPDGTPLAVDKGLEDGRDRAVGTYNGTLTRDERISIDGNPAREFEFDAKMPPIGAVHAIMRGAFRDKRVYMVGAVARKGDTVYLSKGTKFVRSFSILPYTPPVAKKSGAKGKGNKPAPKPKKKP